MFEGSLKDTGVWGPVQVHVSGEGLSRATKGLEAFFSVCKNGLPGEITAQVEGNCLFVSKSCNTCCEVNKNCKMRCEANKNLQTC